MSLTVLSWVFLVGLSLSWVLNLLGLATTYFLVNFRFRPEPAVWPSISLLKPLAGHDDELELNLESHLAIDYPGEWEILVGVRSEKDPAYAIGKAFADAHPERVRFFLQEGEPGMNPKVNQLITLTGHAKYEVIALTDSNVRVRPNHLREHAAYLARERVGLTSNTFVGVGEGTLGSAFDNQTLCSLVMPNVATGDVVLRMQQIISKSIAIKRKALEAVGGWEALKDLLAEDQRLGRYLSRARIRTAVVNTPVITVQKSQPFSYYWGRHTRWAMIRFIVLPGVYAEPLLNPTVMGLAFALATWWERGAWELFAASMVYSTLYTQLVARVGRGHFFAARWALLVPLRDLLTFAAWFRGAFLRTVNWRGNVFRVGPETRLFPVEKQP